MYQKNVASQPVPLPKLLNATTFAEETSGATLYVSIDGGTAVEGVGTLVNISNGGWWYTPTSGEMNGRAIRFKLVKSGCLPSERDIITVDYPRTAIPAVAANASGGLLTYGTSTGQLNPSGGKIPATLAYTDVSGNVAANVKQVNGQTAAATGTVDFDDIGAGGGTADWTSTELQQIRYRLGIDGTTSTPATNAPHLATVDANIVTVAGETATATDTVDFDDMGGGDYASLLKLARADVAVDTGGIPYTLVYYEEGTSTVLMTKELKDINGGDISSANTVVAQRIQA